MSMLDLFLAFLQVGTFSVGGGYAAMPMIQSLTVEQYGWLTMREFTDLITIAEMTPGPIAVNSATFVGIRIAGIPGALVATFGVLLPSLIIVSLLSMLYARYKNAAPMQTIMACLRPAVVALIASAALSILLTVLWDGMPMVLANVHWVGLVLFVLALFVLRWKKCSPILVLVCCGGVNLLLYLCGVG